jgi:hypothetical protein
VLGAERFGLSQQHQHRGRVGRGSEKSYCMLVSDSASAEARRRLTAMEKTHDGFAWHGRTSRSGERVTSWNAAEWSSPSESCYTYGPFHG